MRWSKVPTAQPLLRSASPFSLLHSLRFNCYAFIFLYSTALPPSHYIASPFMAGEAYRAVPSNDDKKPHFWSLILNDVLEMGRDSLKPPGPPQGSSVDTSESHQPALDNIDREQLGESAMRADDGSATAIHGTIMVEEMAALEAPAGVRSWIAPWSFPCFCTHTHMPTLMPCCVLCVGFVILFL